VIDLLVKIGVNAVALLAAANVVPEFTLTFDKGRPEDWGKIALIALVFALVNSYLKPILKVLAMPIGFLTMGLVAFVINAGMLLGTAWLVNQAHAQHRLQCWPLSAYLELRGNRRSRRRIHRHQRCGHTSRSDTDATQDSRVVAVRRSLVGRLTAACRGPR
jgi:putative membrane protein